MNANVHIISPTLLYIYVDDWGTFDQLPGEARPVEGKRSKLPIHQKRFVAQGDQVEIAFLWLDVGQNRK